MKIDYYPFVIFFSYEWNYSNEPLKLLWRNFKNTFIYEWHIPKTVSTNILIVQSMKREDYSVFIDTIFHNISEGKKEKITIKKKKKYSLNIFFKLGLREFINIWNEGQNYTLLKRIYIFLRLAQMLSIEKYIKNYDIKILVAHADMQPIENFIVQYFKSKGVKTVTLQHGLYIDYSKQLNINEVNYKNVVSDHFLAWGEETKKLIQKYHSTCKIEICGNPTIEEVARIQDDFFVLIFEQELFKEYNHELLQVGRKIEQWLNLKLKVKFHPRNIFKEYNITRDEVVKFDTVYNAHFALGHTSTMMYQMMRLGIPVYKLASDIPCNTINKKLTFHNFEELKSLIEHSRNVEFKKEGEFYIKYLGKESLNRYIQFFQRLIDEKN